MKSRLDVSQYPQAWEEYNRRWILAWTIPLALVAGYFGSGLASGRWPWSGLLILAFLSYAILYIRFVRWPCPRCGRPFTPPMRTGVIRAKACMFCGLPTGTTQAVECGKKESLNGGRE
jgi:hypothetical protein